MTKKLPTEYDRRKLEKMKFYDHIDEIEYIERISEAYYELKDEYQELVNVYQDFWENLKIEDYMFDDTKKNRIEVMICHSRNN